ncbi:MAG TPA: hypothetical protein VFX80_09835 [Solirubrobacteraceae bacterium]|nr:hypothetical protein [Solirubrobacteraceae bacterium]
MAARVADGYISTMPDADLLRRFREGGGTGKPAQAGTKVCWGPDEANCRAEAHRLWANEGLPGELAQVLPMPAHFEQASSLVTEEMIGESVPCGPDIERHVAALKAYADAGFDELYVQQIGGRHEAFFETFAREVLPRFH